MNCPAPVMLQNVVVYAGSAQDRELIRDTEFWYTGDKEHSLGTKFNVLLASYETILKDRNELRKIHFEVGAVAWWHTAVVWLGSYWWHAYQLQANPLHHLEEAAYTSDTFHACITCL